MAASKVAISYDEKGIRSLESYAKEVFSCSLAATGWGMNRFLKILKQDRISLQMWRITLKLKKPRVLSAVSEPWPPCRMQPANAKATAGVCGYPWGVQGHRDRVRAFDGCC